MCEQASLLALGRGLLERGLVKPLREKDLIQVAGEPLLNGLFGVPKGAPAPEDPEGREVRKSAPAGPGIRKGGPQLQATPPREPTKKNKND